MKIEGLISKPPGFMPDGRVVHATRLGLKLHPIAEPSRKK